MTRLLMALLFLLAGAAPALAAGACRTQGDAAATEVPIAGADETATLARARMTYEALYPDTIDRFKKQADCSRGTIIVGGVGFTLGGENGDAFPRVAIPDWGPLAAYLYPVPGAAVGAQTAYVLVVTDSTGAAAEKTVFNAIPSDNALAQAFRTALGAKPPMVIFDPRQKVFAYGFQLSTPADPSIRAGDAAKPQIIVDPDGREFVDDPPGNHHRPSGYSCPLLIDGAAVKLNKVTASEDSMICQYVPGVSPVADPDATARYQFTISVAPDATITAAVERFGGATHDRNPGANERRTPPLPGGLTATPAFWTTTDGRAVGVWVGKSGQWLAVMRADYPASPADDQEARTVAASLFGAFYAQVGKSPPVP